MKMNKLYFVLTIICILSMLCAIYANVVYADSIGVQPIFVIDNNMISVQKNAGAVYLSSDNKTIMVPLTTIAKETNGKYTFNKKTNTAVVERKGIKISFAVNKNYYIKDGKKIPMSVSTVLSNKIIHIPAYAYAEAFNISNVCNKSVVQLTQ